MTRIFEDHVLSSLGLDSSQALVPVESLAAPTETVAQGAGLRDLAVLALAAAHLWQPVGAVAERRAGHPTIVAFAEEDVAEVLAGSPTRAADRVVFDTHGAFAAIRTRAGDYVVAKDGAVERYERGVVDPFAALEIQAAPAAIPPFDAVACAESVGAEPWLKRAVAALADQQANLPNAASAGLLARLWTAAGSAPPAADNLPREQVRSWILSASAAQVAELETHAVSRAWSVADRIRELDSAQTSSEHEVADIVEARDDLQSVLRVLRLAAKGEELAHALRGLDALAEARIASLTNLLPDLAEDPQAERWMAVAWQEPNAWWSGAA